MSGKPLYTRKKVLIEDNLLEDLNNIANYAIGNQSPEDCSFNERDTLPEALSYAITYPENSRAVKDARDKMMILLNMTNALYKKIQLMNTQIEVKRKKA
jgi:hypothetical protein